jgi:broad specificity phosphatase PhoE
MSTLYLIRHGEVEERYHRVFGGSRIDMGLSDEGHRQAAELGRWLSQRGVHTVHASPMRRVQETMAPFLQTTALQPTQHHDLREMDFGLWTGHLWDEIEPNFGVSAFEWLDVICAGKLPEGESAADLVARVEPAMQQIIQGNAEQTSAIFCHGGIVRVMLSLLMGLPLTKMASVEIDYASVTQIRFRPHPVHPMLVELVNYCPWRH